MNHVFRSCFSNLRWWLAACALAAVQVAHASDDFPKSFTTAGGRSVWVAPDQVSKRTVGQAVWNAATGGTAVVQTGEVALANGAKVALTSTRLLTAANVGRAAVSLASGPGAVVTALTLAPALAEWIAKDEEKKVRVAPDRSGVQIKGEAPDYPKANGYEYRGGYPELSWRVNPVTACTEDLALSSAKTGNIQKFIEMDYYGSDGGYAECRFSFAPQGNPNQVSIRTFQLTARNADSCPKGWYITPSGCIQNPGQAEWLPASMSDISPYLYPYAYPPDLPKQLVTAGINIDAPSTGVTGPAQGPAEPEQKAVEQIPTPSDQTETRTRSGNPYSLSPNTPTQTGSTSGSTPISVGGNTVNAPTHSTTTSTYNPTTNNTTSTTTTTTDPLRKETTTNNTTNITYTTNNATTNTTNTTTTNIINNITNTVINTTVKTNDSPLPPNTEEEPTPDMCETNPDSLACAKLGDVPAADPLNKTSKAFQMTAAAFSESASCPPPVTFSLALAGVAGSYTIPYTPACEVMAMLRALVLAIAGFAAAYVLADSFKVT